MEKNDGGPAFPTSPNGVDPTWAAARTGGMTLRDYFMAHAPAQEIADVVPADIRGCAQYLGIEPSAYKAPVHYFQVLAKIRGEWADAMLAEREK